MINQYRSKNNLLLMSSSKQESLKEKYHLLLLSKHKQTAIKESQKGNLFVKQSFHKRGSQRSADEIEQTEKLWEEREKNSRKQDYKVISKSNKIDTLIIVAAILILYCFALILAPNQYYYP